ncbi:MAPEG family protein [Teredinibacter turnerae]|uniref:Membrane protein n=1 Tax=Teredinibacter turnerae (strain ATCC 39867 / T7901) TaxID=377629 RepID=C5BN57_TERTT|nr:MAPEG family protein [Teredinibacter turnerae]ACR11488.1 putative membrane protein [Teredinibacter turnerae T7901]
MLYPMFALVMCTFVFIFVQLYLRVHAVKSRAVRMRYFKLYQTNADMQPVPAYLVAGQNHFANLFETPLLFYVAGVLAIVMKVEPTAMVVCGWSYVVTRVVHAFIHCTYNHVLHRAITYWVSLMLLLAMWILLVVNAN